MDQSRRQRTKQAAAIVAAVLLGLATTSVVAQQDLLAPPPGLGQDALTPPAPSRNAGAEYSASSPGRVAPAAPDGGEQFGEQRRNLIRLVNPQRGSSAWLEIDVERMPFRQALLHIYRSGGFERGVVVLGDEQDDLVSLFYTGSADGLDRVLDELLDAAGWVRVRSFDAPDLIYKSSTKQPLYADPLAAPFDPAVAPPSSQYVP